MTDMNNVPNPENIPMGAPAGMTTATPAQVEIDLWEAILMFVADSKDDARVMLVGDAQCDRKALMLICRERLAKAELAWDAELAAGGVVTVPGVEEIVARFEAVQAVLEDDDDGNMTPARRNAVALQMLQGARELPAAKALAPVAPAPDAETFTSAECEAIANAFSMLGAMPLTTARQLHPRPAEVLVGLEDFAKRMGVEL